MLRLQLNKIIINDKSSERVFELALMEDEYDTNLDKIVKEIYTNGKSLHQLPHKLGKTDLGRELSSSESEAKIKAINKYGGRINIKDLIKISIIVKLKFYQISLIYLTNKVYLLI